MLINILLFFTVSSAIFKSPQDIFEDPTKIANIFASKLPEVSKRVPFFFSGSMLLL
jgi:hypothetical protein